MPEPKPEINKVSEHWLLYTYPGEPDMYINLSKIVYLRTVQIAGLDDELLLYMQGSGNISLSGITTADILLVLLP